jgi:hypothetical protein
VSKLLVLSQLDPLPAATLPASLLQLLDFLSDPPPVLLRLDRELTGLQSSIELYVSTSLG